MYSIQLISFFQLCFASLRLSGFVISLRKQALFSKINYNNPRGNVKTKIVNSNLNAAFAAATALSTSALSPSWTSVMTSSVAGLMVLKVLPDTEG